ncbi:MAG TPA: hypothetical protein VGN17_18745 [Bryobacteraceae bacterium]
MKLKIYGPIATAVLVLGAACITFAPGFSQQPPPGAAGGKGKGGKGGGGGKGGYKAPDGPTPRLPNGKPDFSGFWQRPYSPDMSAGATNMKGDPYPPEDPQHRNTVLASAAGATKGGGGRGARVLPFTPAGAKNWASYDPTDGDYTGACLPFGLMRSINSPDPLQIMQSNDYFAELFEQNTWFHVFHIDGRPHTKGTPTWFGDSVGHWDGDTLVVETNNFNGHTRLDTNGHPHSDALVLTERWTRTNMGNIDYDMTIHDPKTYTEDWKNSRKFTLRTDQEIMEYSCEENNKSLWEGRIKPPKYEDQ